MPDLRWRNFVLVVRRALSTPLSISLLGIGVLFALVMHSVPGLAILGGTIAVVMLYALAKVHDESFMRATIQEALDHEHKTELTNRVFRIEELDPECRVKMKTIARLFSEIAEDVANSPIDAAATGLTEMVKQAESLLERGLRMAQKRRDLMHYLTETDSQAIEMRIRDIQSSLERESDPARKSQLEKSSASRQQELDDYHAIEQASSRVLDQLDSIECSFSGLRARLVRIKSTNIDEWTAANVELLTELGGLSRAADVLEHSVEEALSMSRTQL